VNGRKGKYAQGGTPLTAQATKFYSDEEYHEMAMKLNPDWVEQLMDLPVGWTVFDFSETE